MHKTSTQAAIYRHNASYKRKARIQGRGGITSAKPGYEGEAALQAQSPDTRARRHYKRKARIQGRGGITSAKPGYKGEAALQAQSPDTRVIALVRAAAAVNSAMSNNLRNLWIAAIVVVSVVI